MDRFSMMETLRPMDLGYRVATVNSGAIVANNGTISALASGTGFSFR